MIISDARRDGSVDWTGDEITAEQDLIVDQILEHSPSLCTQLSRCMIYRLYERGDIEIGKTYTVRNK